MTIIFRTFNILVFLFCFATLEAQSDTLKLPEIEWTAVAPSGFKSGDVQQIKADVEKGLSAIEDANNITVDTNSLRTLASYYKEQYNMFNITIQPFDPAIDGLYDSVSLAAHWILYETMKEKMPNAKLDSSSFKRTIGGQLFNGFRMNFQLNSKHLMTMVIYSIWRKGYDTGISYVALNEGIAAEIEDMLSKSSFTPAIRH